MVAHSTGEAAQVLRYGYDDGPGRQRWLPSSAQMPGAAASEADAQPGQGVPVRFSWGPLLRPESVTDSGGATTSFDFDFEGNLASLTPPATPEHGAAAAHPFDVTGWNKLKQDTPPGVSGVPEPQTEWAYDNDGALPSVRLPDGRTVTVDYDADHGYRVSKMHFGVGDLTLGYVERTPTPGGPGQAPTCASDGELVSATMPQYGGEQAVTTAVERDGPLVTKLTWSGGVSGEVSFGYDPPDGEPFTGLVRTLSAAGQSATYAYDPDGLVTAAGSMTISRDPDSGLPLIAHAGAVTSGYVHDEFGAPRSASHQWPGGELTDQLTYDAAGRIKTRTETDGDTTTVYAYTYDAAGRLREVHVDGALRESYEYDQNGNRITWQDLRASAQGAAPGHQSSGAQASGDAALDAQDRLLHYGHLDFTYNATGQLESRSDTVSGEHTAYHYDELGRLLAVTLPTGIEVSYLIDAAGRRVGRRVGGSGVTDTLVYLDALRPAASPSRGQLYLYTSGRNVPGLIVTAGATYRVVTDWRGSVRRIIDTDSGVVVQAIDYTAYGRVLRDTAPGFQPFGFAGGLTDPDTYLVHFGARDYDPETARWLTKDPLLFGGGDTLLYAYVGGDPVNFIDPSGLQCGEIVVPLTLLCAAGGCEALEALLAAAGVGAVVLGSQPDVGTVVESRGRGNQKGERKHAAKPTGTPNPAKHVRWNDNKGVWEQKDPHTGKWREKPKDWKPPGPDEPSPLIFPPMGNRYGP